ncbi:cytochrome P450 71D8-like [Senna tora]|uniref:Cytochrome P450 71D8-like n=1 Tax=Senna tora TaxID=362788 RepID=A0A834X9F8_9FABA|nr:cytochrome P450 71D8-like [Senna tora]
MESQFSIFLLIIIVFLFFIFLWIANQKSKSKLLPPGPWKLPLLGNLHQLAASSSLTHHALRDLSLKYGPLMHLQLGELSTVIASSPEMAKEIMKTHDLAFVDRPKLGTLIFGLDGFAFAPYGDYWRQMRKICTLQLLSVKKVHSFSSVRQDEVAEFIESIQSSVGAKMDLTSKIFSYTSTIATRIIFGRKSRSDQDQDLLKLLKIVLEEGSGFGFVDLFPSMKIIHLISGLKKFKKISKKIDQILEDVIKENQEKQMRTERGKDGYHREENLVQVLLQIQQSSGLEIPITTKNIKAAIWDLYIGGTDTAATTIEWTMSELIKSPKAMEKAQAEIREAFKGKKEIEDTDMDKLNYLKCVIKETLRLHPPAPLLIPRECREACKINGYEIPIKTKVIVNAWAIGRDPKYWYEAERFIPERFQGSCVDFVGKNFEYIPFGGGRRICPGISLGIASIELPLARLLYHFDWELPDGKKAEDLDMTEAFGGTVGRKNKLCLIPTRPHLTIYDK